MTPTALLTIKLATLLWVLQAQNRPESSGLPPSLQAIFTKAVEAQRSNRLEEAEKLYLQVIEGGGKLAFVYSNLGAVYQQRREHPKAVDHFRQAIRLQSNFPAPRALLGASLLALGRTPEAIAELERAVKLDPRQPLSRAQLAKAYEKAERPEKVVDQYRVLRQLASEDPEYAYQLGNAYLKLQASCYKRISRVNPRSPRLYQILGDNYRIQGQADLAVHAYQRAIEADPKFPGLHMALAEIYLTQGKEAEAVSELDKELIIVPDNATALALREKLVSKK